MRRLAVLALAALAACGLEPGDAPPPSPGATVAVSEPIALDVVASHVVAVGQGWRLDSDPQAGLTLDRAAEGDLISADYVAPTREADGATRIASGRINLKLVQTACTQGETPYPMRAEIAVQDGPTLAGCAYARWDTRIAELMPAIDSCLSLSPEGSTVLYAAPEDGGRILVRIAAGEETRSDCRAPRDPGAGPAIIVTADPMLRLPGERDPIFVRAPGVQPGGECYSAPEIRGPDGALLGWLAEDGPC